MKWSGKKMADKRFEIGYTQEDLSICVGLSKNTISNWERDLYPPSAANLLILARALECDPEEFFINAARNNRASA